MAMILERAFFEALPADKALSSYLRQNHQLGSRDRRIISETLFAVLRWWGWLRHVAPPAFASAVARRAALRYFPSYEEWFPCFGASWLLDGGPQLPPAALWWLRKSGIDYAEMPAQPLPVSRRHVLLRPFFSQHGGMPPMGPEDLFPKWCRGEVDTQADWMKLTEWFQARPPVWLRAQTDDVGGLIREFSRLGVGLSPAHGMPQALKATFAGINLRQTEPFLKGRFEIQDAASQAISIICSPNPGENWWDCCAGAGGKTLHLAWLMNGKGRIQATDNRFFKLEDLKKRARRCGFSNILCKEWLGLEVPRLRKHFHGVLVDAPCSCSGTWRRNPGARWTTDANDVAELCELQLRLLSNAATAVAPGGTLAYATCSMFKRENQGVVDAFLERHGDEFELEPFKSPLTGACTDGSLQIWPWDMDCDAMFAAKFRRRK